MGAKKRKIDTPSVEDQIDAKPFSSPKKSKETSHSDNEPSATTSSSSSSSSSSSDQASTMLQSVAIIREKYLFVTRPKPVVDHPTSQPAPTTTTVKGGKQVASSPGIAPPAPVGPK